MILKIPLVLEILLTVLGAGQRENAGNVDSEPTNKRRKGDNCRLQSLSAQLSHSGARFWCWARLDLWVRVDCAQFAVKRTTSFGFVGVGIDFSSFSARVCFLGMADGEEKEERDESEGWQPPRRMSAMGVEIEPDLEAPLLGTLESLKPQSRVAPLLVLLVFIIVVIVLASMMGNLSSRYDVRSTSQNDTHPP